MARIKLNNVDLAWLRMENPNNPMMITVVMHFDGQIDYDRLSSLLDVSLARYRRFRQRVVIPNHQFRRPYWEDDPDYRVDDHIERLEITSPVDDAALDRAINQKMNIPLDFAHPLWKVSLIANHPEGSVIIVRVHHCIADGISLMQIFRRMTRASKEDSIQLPPVVDRGNDENQANDVPEGVAPEFPATSNTVDPPLTLSQTRSAEPSAQSGGKPALQKPSFSEILAASARIIFRPPDPPTLLKGPLGTVKRAIWSEPYNVLEIKQIAKKRKATINDVLMAISSGAARRYMDLHNDLRTRSIRAFILVNLRGHSFDEELGNKFGLVFLSLPLKHQKPMERLSEIKKGMDNLKASAEYAASYFILNILGFLPVGFENLAIKILDQKGTIVATNVPGPRRPVYLADTCIRSIKAAVPQSGRIGIGLSFVSYNDQIIVGFNADAGLVPDPEKFLGFFKDEFEELKAASSDLTL